MTERIDVRWRGAVGAEHADAPTFSARHFVDRNLDHAEDRTTRGFANLSQPDVRGVAGDHEEVGERGKPRGHVDELRIDLPRLPRAPVITTKNGELPVIPDDHRGVPAVPFLRNEALGGAMDACLEIHRRLRAHASKNTHPSHASLLGSESRRVRHQHTRLSGSSWPSSQRRCPAGLGDDALGMEPAIGAPHKTNLG